MYKLFANFIKFKFSLLCEKEFLLKKFEQDLIKVLYKI